MGADGAGDINGKTGSEWEEDEEGWKLSWVWNLSKWGWGVCMCVKQSSTSGASIHTRVSQMHFYARNFSFTGNTFTARTFTERWMLEESKIEHRRLLRLTICQRQHKRSELVNFVYPLGTQGNKRKKRGGTIEMSHKAALLCWVKWPQSLSDSQTVSRTGRFWKGQPTWRLQFHSPLVSPTLERLCWTAWSDSPMSPIAFRTAHWYLLPVISNSTLSLRPNLSSGIPDSTTLSLMVPTISLRRTLPLALTWGRRDTEKHHSGRMSMSSNRKVLSLDRHWWNQRWVVLY